MDALRRALYAHAALLALAGLALLLAPGFVVHTVLREPLLAGEELAWVRLLGVHWIGVAMFATLVGHRVAELWWWSWAFALVDVAAATVVLLNTAFGLASGQSAIAWWVLSGVAVALAAAMLHGVFASSHENPLP